MIDTANLVQEVMDGKCSPYKALHFLKDYAKQIKNQIEIVETEAFNQSEYEDRTFLKDGFEIEKRNGRKVWNFKNCNSFKLANDNLEEIKNDLKQNFSLFEKGKSSVDENGEIGEIPLVTFTKDSIIIKKI
tara:strand:+ start:141 stop:533 length:393 start_codon:yes stop_codon:yes gene_type:complete